MATMALLNAGVRTFSNRLPKALSPKQHAIIDYASAGAFITAGILMMRSKKHAGIGSIVCGVAQAGLVMMTDMPGGVFPAIDLPTHLEVDTGFSALVASLPALLGFSNEKKAWFFRTQGMSIVAVGAMTNSEQFSARNMRRKRVA